MRCHFHLGLTLAAAGLFGLASPADARALMIAPVQQPGQLASQADVVIVGKVVEIEKDTVEATPFKGAPKEQKQAYKIAIVKLEDSIIGGKGLTQFRVGFPDGAAAGPAGEPGPGPGVGGPAVKLRPIRGRGPVALTAGQEGVFFLSQHHDGDFYILAMNGTAPPLNAKDENYKKQLEEVKKIAKTLDDPVAALKAKDVNDRFQAAQLLLQRYQINRTGGVASREAIPADENKLILALLTELPWQPKETEPRTGSDPVPPSRSALWYMVQQDMTGYKQPAFPVQKPGDPPVDFNKIMDDATTNYLKDNIDKIKLKRFAK
jgi:hypothetical protein